MAGTSAAIRKLQALADRAEPSLRKAYLEAIAVIQRATSAIRLAAAIERGDVTAVDRILADAHLERALRQAADVIRQLVRDAARLTTVPLTDQVSLGGFLRQVNPRAVQVAEQQAARMVTRVSGETKKAIREIVTRSLGGEMTAQQAARLIKPLIGLTAQQAKAVLRYRAELEAAGTPADKVAAALDRYTQKLLRLRARTIARTETIAASNAGQQAVWQQMQRTGLIPQDAQRRWIVTPDDRLCPVCAAIDGQVVGIDEPFATSLGAVMNPPAHPNCRCSEALVTASLASTRGLRLGAVA